MMLKTNIVFIDFETTGINVFDSDPIEIGAIKVNQNFEVINTFSSFIKPIRISRQRASSYKIHGHSLESLQNAQKQEDVLTEFFNLFGTDYCFAGWNISFDIPFFKKMCYRNNKMTEFNKIDYHHIDIQSIVRIMSETGLLNQNVSSLDDGLAYFNLCRSDKHMALEDANASLLLFQKLLFKLK